MSTMRVSIHTAFLIALPIVIATFGISIMGAIVLVLLGLVWRVAISASFLASPPKIPKLQLETIGASHFVEKVRWCMDRLGVDYVERQGAGILGLFLSGRTVPRLVVRTGAVQSVIGNSPEILRFLWGAYAPTLGEKADFLEATEEHIQFEREIDRYGAQLQPWVYYHILDDRELALDLLGRRNSTIPRWQRWALITLFPLLRFSLRQILSLSAERYRDAVDHIESFLRNTEEKLRDGRKSVLGGEEIDYVDISLAAISGLWVQPDEFGAGQADSVRVDRDRIPKQMAADIERWRREFPYTVAFIERLYREERIAQG